MYNLLTIYQQSCCNILLISIVLAKVPHSPGFLLQYSVECILETRAKLTTGSASILGWGVVWCGVVWWGVVWWGGGVCTDGVMEKLFGILRGLQHQGKNLSEKKKQGTKSLKM